MKKLVTFVGIIFIIFPVNAAKLYVANFSSGNLTHWTEKKFVGRTAYRLQESSNWEGGVTFLEAESRNSASGLFREVLVDLKKTPCINWTWKVDSVFQKADETKKSGDDFAARIYVIFSNNTFLANAEAINYVWAGRVPKGTTWDSPYSEHFKMIAIRSGMEDTGRWIFETRDVQQDYFLATGKTTIEANGVAIMTDSDNSGGIARAGYGDIYFSDKC